MCGKVIVGKFAAGAAADLETAHVLVCRQHLLPDWLLATSPRLMHDSARGVVERILERDQLERGEAVPSLRRPAVRVRPTGWVRRVLGQAARRRRRRGSLAGSCSRAFDLLASLLNHVLRGDAGCGAAARKKGPVK